MKENNGKRPSNNEANRITREAICTALVYLMEAKDFESITIAELARKAGVSRQSFYRNYTSKEDIVIEIEEKMLTSFADSLNDTKYANDLHHWMYDLFCFVKNNRKLISVLHKAKLFDMLFPKAPFVVENWKKDDNPWLHYLIIGSLGALKSIGEEWFTTGMKESCEEMADICMKYNIDHLV